MEEVVKEIQPLPAKVHNQYLNAIKKLLGASFVGWEQEKNKKQLKITVKKNNIYLPFQGGDLITEDSYKQLIKDIIESYGGEVQKPIQLDEAERGA